MGGGKGMDLDIGDRELKGRHSQYRCMIHIEEFWAGYVWYLALCFLGMCVVCFFMLFSVCVVFFLMGESFLLLLLFIFWNAANRQVVNNNPPPIHAESGSPGLFQTGPS